MENVMKKCAFCAEEIQDDAIKCRFCGEFQISLPQAEKKTPWYLKTTSIVGAFAVLGPLALPLVWLRPGLRTSTKIIITVLMLLITALLVFVTGKMLHSMMKYYQIAGSF